MTMKDIDIWCSAAIVLGLCVLPIIIILGIIVYRDNREERNHNKRCDDDFDLRKYEYSGGTVKDFNDRCRKSFFDSIGLHEEDEKDDKDI